MWRKLLGIVLASMPVAAQAGWHVATSDHFIVYTQGGAAAAREAAARLEKFQYVLRVMTGAKGAPSPVKVAVFMMSNDAAVQATMPFGGGGGVAGYYSGTIRGPFAVATRTNAGSGNGSKGQEDTGLTALTGQQVLQHELTHHFTRQYFPAAYPTWYSEGFADYFGSLAIRDGNTVAIGAPVNNRYRGFQANMWLPLSQMLTARSYADVGSDVTMLYAEGWLLVHYLSNTKARPGQLANYLTGINQGKPFDQAAKEAFGDIGKLDAELHGYAGRGLLQQIVLPFKSLDTGPIVERELTPAESAMLPFDIALYWGFRTPRRRISPNAC